MPTCPDCGSIIMEGDPYCTHCGAQIVWSEEVFHNNEYEPPKIRQCGDKKEDDFFQTCCDLGFPAFLVCQMQDYLSEVKSEFNVRFKGTDHVDMGLIFNLEGERKYYDIYLSATFFFSGFYIKQFYFDPYDVTADFTKLYDDEDFKRLIKRTEDERGSKFLHCEIGYIPGAYLVSAIFDDGKYYINLDKMEFAK